MKYKAQSDNENKPPLAKPSVIKEMMAENENPLAKLIKPVKNMIKPQAERIVKTATDAIWNGLRTTPFGMFLNDVPPKRRGK